MVRPAMREWFRHSTTAEEESNPGQQQVTVFEKVSDRKGEANTIKAGILHDSHARRFAREVFVAFTISTPFPTAFVHGCGKCLIQLHHALNNIRIH